MDKNMINIDDLFRQGLSGGEEKERPGSWLQMRELLDKEMPVVAGNTTNWRRMFGYAAGLMLLASASIGGYTAYTSFRDAEKQLPAPTVAINATNPGNVGGSSNIAITGNTEEKQEGATIGANSTVNTPAGLTTEKKNVDNRSVAQNEGNGQAVEKQSAINTKKHNISGKSAATVTPVAAAKATTNDNRPVVAQKATAATNKSTTSQQAVASSTSTSGTAASKSTIATPVAANTSASTANKTTTASNSNAPAQEKMFASAASTTNDNKKPAASPLQNKPSVSTNTSANGAFKNDLAKNDNHKKNLIDKVEERETYDRKTGLWKKDTIDKGKVEWKQQEELIAAAKVDKPADNTTTVVVPAAAVEVKAENEAEKLVALSDFRTSSKNSNYQTHNIFEEMVKNAKLQLGGVRFYPGLIVGINTALSGNNSMTGFQVGVTGNLSLNEKWGIVSELKYMQRFKNGSRESNRNDYITNTQSLGNGMYQWDSIVSHFTYPTVSSVELPVMIKYSFNRFNMLAGANLAYYMGFSPNEVQEKHRFTGTKPPIQPTTEGGAIMTPADFGSRLGVGYLFGVGYQMSPAIQLDMRMSQSLWDDAAGAGAARVSKEVFQLPSLQFNMSYRFSSNKYKPYRAQQ